MHHACTIQDIHDSEMQPLLGFRGRRASPFVQMLLLAFRYEAGAWMLVDR
jgi:hypothetical protein